MLKRVPVRPSPIPSEAQPGALWLSPILAVALIALNLLNSPGSARTASTETASEWKLPPSLNAQVVPLRAGELDWLLQDGAESVTRVRFRWRDLSGSLLLVPSTNWRAHHYPERCFENDGLVIEHGKTHLVNQDMPVRFLTLSSDSHMQRSATYWFQSANRVSDDYSTRLWSAVSLHPERWVMVSILFDRVYDPRTENVQSLYLTLRDVVRAYIPGHSAGGNIQ